MKKASELLMPYIEKAKDPNIVENLGESFKTWTTRIGDTGIVQKAKQIFEYFISGKVGGTEKLIVIASLLYIISPIDFIPDSIPIVGWLDDIGVAGFCLSYINSALAGFANKKSLEEVLDVEVIGTDNKFELDMSTDNAFRINTDIETKKLHEKLSELQSVYNKLTNENDSSFFDNTRNLLEENRMMKVAFTGRYNTGKSSLLNALLGRDFLPVGPIPTTKATCHIVKGEKEAYYYTNKNDEIVVSYNLSELNDLYNEGLNKIDSFTISLPDYPFEDLTLIDTPGLEDPEENTSNKTKEILGEIDAFVVLIDAKYPLSAPELEFIEKVVNKNSERKLYIVANKSESLSEKEIDTLRKNLINALENNNIVGANVYFLSAKRPTSLDFGKFKTELFEFLRGGIKAESLKHIKSNIKSFSSNLLACCSDALDKTKVSEKEKSEHINSIKKQIENIEKIHEKQLRVLSQKVASSRNAFYNEYDSFFGRLKGAVANKIHSSKLDNLRNTDAIAIEIKNKISEFLTKEIEEIKSTLATDISEMQNSITNELSEISIQINTEIKDYSGYSELFMPALAVITWPMLGIFNFIWTMLVANIGKDFFQGRIQAFLGKVGLNAVKNSLVEESNSQIDEIKDKLKLELNKIFENIEKQIVADFEKSKYEAIAPLKASINLISENSSNAVEQINECRNKLATINKEL